MIIKTQYTKTAGVELEQHIDGNVWHYKFEMASRTDVEAETPILRPSDAKSWHLKRLWCWERLRAGGEGDYRGWGAWMALPTRWTWVWVNSRNWWWTGRPGSLWFMGSQRVGHDWVTELNWTELNRAWPCLTGQHADLGHRQHRWTWGMNVHLSTCEPEKTRKV